MRTFRYLQIVVLYVLSSCIAYAFIAWVAYTDPQAAQQWLTWAEGFRPWVVQTFGLTGYAGSAARLLITKHAVIVTMSLLITRFALAFLLSGVTGRVQGFVSTVVFYATAVALAHAVMITLFVIAPNPFNAFFDSAEVVLGRTKTLVPTTDVLTLAFKDVVFNASALMTLTLVFLMRLVLSILAWIVGYNDGEA